MPHRAAEYRELCTVCRTPTHTGCPRCGVPLCAEHALPDYVRCADCEAVFARRTRVESRVVQHLDHVAALRAEGRHAEAAAVPQYTELRRPFAVLGIVCILWPMVVAAAVRHGFAAATAIATFISVIALVWAFIAIPPTGSTCRMRLKRKRARFLAERKRSARWLAARPAAPALPAPE